MEAGACGHARHVARAAEQTTAVVLLHSGDTEAPVLLLRGVPALCIWGTVPDLDFLALAMGPFSASSFSFIYELGKLAWLTSEVEKSIKQNTSAVLTQGKWHLSLQPAKSITIPPVFRE